MWIRLGGAAQAAVGRPQRFIRSEPSPSTTITLRCGRPKPMPRPMLDASPSERLLKLPSLGCRWDQSTLALPPAWREARRVHAAGIRENRQGGKAKRKQGGGKAVEAIEEPAVLHDQRGCLAGQIGAGADANPFLLPSQPDVNPAVLLPDALN